MSSNPLTDVQGAVLGGIINGQNEAIFWNDKDVIYWRMTSTQLNANIVAASNGSQSS